MRIKVKATMAGSKFYNGGSTTGVTVLERIVGIKRGDSSMGNPSVQRNEANKSQEGAYERILQHF